MPIDRRMIDCIAVLSGSRCCFFVAIEPPPIKFQVAGLHVFAKLRSRDVRHKSEMRRITDVGARLPAASINEYTPLALLWQIYLRRGPGCKSIFGSAGIAAVVVEDEFEDGVAHGGQGWLRRRPVDSFFPASLL